MARGKKYDHTPVESIRHADKRANIPTEELRDFVAEEERSPKYVVYPRDTSLDPQLVWKGKDEQDAKDLEIPAVPIYVQEKIHPQALIENLRQTAKTGEPEPELTLFDDYDGIEFEELIDFYQHEQNWANRLILGDSLLVMNSLAEKEGLKGQVQMIYMDPPYGIKFGSNWQVSTRKRDVKDGRADDVTRQPEQVKAFRDTWELGVHSYLSYLRDRLVVARELLGPSGSVFLQIGDENVHLVRNILDEVLGSENFISQIAFTKSGGGLESTSRVPARLDYIVWYAKSATDMKYRTLWEPRDDHAASGFTQVELPDGERRSLRRGEKAKDLPSGSRLFRTESLTKPGPGSKYDLVIDGKTYDSGNRWWGSPKESIERLVAVGRVAEFGSTLRFIRYADDFPYRQISNLWSGLGGAPDPIYAVQTNTKVVERCMLMTTDPGDLVLDPTCGSGTTAFVAEQWGRRWMTTDTSRVALALARTRLMAARYPFYLLSDSPEGAAKEMQQSGVPAPERRYARDVRLGFVNKRAPRVTMAAIANNPALTPGMSRNDINTIIARSANAEPLVDRPFEDASHLRVSGPFTVESLSPHRTLPAGSKGEEDSQLGRDETDFASMIIENLARAGVQNTRRAERMVFERLEAHPGRWINAVGEYTDKDDVLRRIAISIGPEHGTVGSEQVKEAAKEAMRGVGYDALVVLGFAFDAHAGETVSEISLEEDSFALAAESRTLGRMRVLLGRVNPDLEYGGELLKKTGAANLFMVFGEPDVDLEVLPNGQVVLSVNGVDVYDPTTGEIRSSSTDEIACWFVDTNYNGESFFVRHAYFTGADDPYENLRRSLRSEIDESAWATLYSARSRPFSVPETGQIAVKVINHYGDEVLKVFDV